MELLRSKLAELLPQLRADRKALAKDKGETILSSVTVEQVLGGMRGVPAMICETSSVSADEGLRIRNTPILELTDLRPEDIFFLLITGSKPNEQEREELKNLFSQNAEVPQEVWNVLEAMPKDTHPMVMLSTGVLAMERESRFRKSYEEGAGKDDFWVSTLEDSILLLSRMTGLAAGIYRLRFNKGQRIAPKKGLDWSENFAHMLGISDDKTFGDLIRLYLVLHSDHEGGNVSAMTSYTVSSALSDVFYTLSAGLNGLAGPLHGLANQECLRFIVDLKEEFGGVPTDEQLREYTWNRLNGGQVIPGYGHAVLRVTDPRFTAFYQFAEQNNLESDVIQIMQKLFKIVPEVLKEQGKAKNPWPNVDAASGSLLYYYGLQEFEYYTVMFGVSRALGICAQNVVNRMSNMPIVRPKSLTFEELQKQASK